jgi:hypothetical protein
LQLDDLTCIAIDAQRLGALMEQQFVRQFGQLLAAALPGDAAAAAEAALLASAGQVADSSQQVVRQGARRGGGLGASE